MGIFWCPAAFRPRQTGRCGRIFSVFCGKAGVSVHRHLWTSGGACGWLGEFVRPGFYAYPQDSGGRVFMLQCPDSRSAGVAYGYAYRAFQHSFPQAVKKAGKSPQSFPHGVENRGCFRQWRCGERGFAPCIPGAEPARHLQNLPLCFPVRGFAPCGAGMGGVPVPGGGQGGLPLCGTGSPCHCGTRRGRAFFVARLPFTLALFFPPSPRPPSRREGGD